MTGFAVYTAQAAGTSRDGTSAVVQTLVDTIKRDSFTPGYKATDAEAFGELMAQYFNHGTGIFQAAVRALEAANYHGQATLVEEIYLQLVKADDDAPIDDDMRKALLARLSEVYGKQIVTEAGRTQRLSILSTLAGTPIHSVSRRYGNMTVGDFRRVMKVLDTLSQ